MREAVITVLLTSSLMCGATENHTQFKLQKGTHKPIYPWKTVKFQSAYPRQGRGGAGTYTRLRHCRQAVAGPDNHSHLRSAWSHRWTLPHLCDWRWSSWRVYRENPQTGSESVKLNDECVMNVHLESIINFLLLLLWESPRQIICLLLTWPIACSSFSTFMNLLSVLRLFLLQAAPSPACLVQCIHPPSSAHVQIISASNFARPEVADLFLILLAPSEHLNISSCFTSPLTLDVSDPIWKCHF